MTHSGWNIVFSRSLDVTPIKGNGLYHFSQQLPLGIPPPASKGRYQRKKLPPIESRKLHPEAPGTSYFWETSYSVTSLLCLSFTYSVLVQLWSQWTCFSQTTSFSPACSQVPKELLCPSLPGHERPHSCVKQPGEEVAESTSSHAGVQIKQVFGPEAICSPILPAAVGSLLLEIEHMLHSVHPICDFITPVHSAYSGKYRSSDRHSLPLFYYTEPTKMFRNVEHLYCFKPLPESM